MNMEKRFERSENVDQTVKIGNGEITFPAARPRRTMPNFKPETCEDVEDDDDDVAPPAFDAGKIFIFETNKPATNNGEKLKNDCLAIFTCHTGQNYAKDLQTR